MVGAGVRQCDTERGVLGVEGQAEAEVAASHPAVQRRVRGEFGHEQHRRAVGLGVVRPAPGMELPCCQVAGEAPPRRRPDSPGGGPGARLDKAQQVMRALPRAEVEKESRRLEKAAMLTDDRNLARGYMDRARQLREENPQAPAVQRPRWVGKALRGSESEVLYKKGRGAVARRRRGPCRSAGGGGSGRDRRLTEDAGPARPRASARAADRAVEVPDRRAAEGRRSRPAESRPVPEDLTAQAPAGVMTRPAPGQCDTPIPVLGPHMSGNPRSAARVLLPSPTSGFER